MPSGPAGPALRGRWYCSSAARVVDGPYIARRPFDRGIANPSDRHYHFYHFSRGLPLQNATVCVCLRRIANVRNRRRIAIKPLSPNGFPGSFGGVGELSPGPKVSCSNHDGDTRKALPDKHFWQGFYCSIRPCNRHARGGLPPRAWRNHVAGQPGAALQARREVPNRDAFSTSSSGGGILIS